MISDLYKSKTVLLLQSQNEGSLAQLVQSICLTSRGSGVRIPQLPQKASKSRLFLCRQFNSAFLNILWAMILKNKDLRPVLALNRFQNRIDNSSF